jgi:hypothetical protein
MGEKIKGEREELLVPNSQSTVGTSKRQILFISKPINVKSTKQDSEVNSF